MPRKNNLFGASQAVVRAVWVHMIRVSDPELGKVVNEGNVDDLEKDIQQMDAKEVATFVRKHNLAEREVSTFIEQSIIEKLGAKDSSEALSNLIESLLSGSIRTTSEYGMVSGLSAFVSHAVEEKIKREENNPAIRNVPASPSNRKKQGKKER